MGGRHPKYHLIALALLRAPKEQINVSIPHSGCKCFMGRLYKDDLESLLTAHQAGCRSLDHGSCVVGSLYLLYQMPRTKSYLPYTINYATIHYIYTQYIYIYTHVYGAFQKLGAQV